MDVESDTYLLPVIGGRTTSPPALSVVSSTKIAAGSKENNSNNSISSKNDHMSQSVCESVGEVRIENSGESSSSIGSIRSTKHGQISREPFVHRNGNEQMDTADATTTTDAASIPSVVAAYPSDTPVPSRETVRFFYEEAMRKSSETDSDTSVASDQVSLREAGLLSLEGVILPTWAYHTEENVLVPWQKRVQRDAPEFTPVLKALRNTVYQSIRAASCAARDSRTNFRAPQEAQREAVWQRQRQLQEAARTTAAQQARAHRLRDAQKSLPANQELWREIAHLQTELLHLKLCKEQWKSAHQSVLEQQQEASTEVAPSVEMSSLGISDSDTVMANENETETLDAEKVAETARAIANSAGRIHRAVKLVNDIILPRTERTHDSVYRQYVSDNHQFSGYQGVQDPKGLIRALSQSQPDDGDDIIDAAMSW